MQIQLIKNVKRLVLLYLRQLEERVFKAKTVFNNPKTGEKYIDPQGRGRLAAYIPSLNGDPFDPYFFEYASPFGGAASSAVVMDFLEHPLMRV